MLTTLDKKQIIDNFKLSPKDTGSPEIQVAMLTTRINELTEHLKTFKKDFSARRGLLKMVGKRRRYLQYLSKEDHSRYLKLIETLNLRR